MRTSATITPAEVQQWMKFCRDNDIVADGSEKGLANADFANEYFTKTWGEDITTANLAAAKTLILPYLKLYSADELEFNAVLTKLTPAQAQIFQDWKPPRGLKQTERAATAILSWLTAHKFEITARNLDLAVGQKTIAQFLEYEYIPQHQQTEHSRTDDGKGFLHGDGLTLQRDGSLGKSPARYAKERREAAEKLDPTITPEHKLSADDQSWLRVARDACRFGNHSQQAQIQKIYDQSTAQGLSPRKIAEACDALRNTFKKNEMVQNRAGYYSR
jgi:hypothetical protein